MSSSSDDVARLRRFLLRAAFEPDENRTHFGRPADDDEELEALDEAFAAAREAAGLTLGQGESWTPPRSLCLQLADWTAWLDAYGDHHSPPFDQIYIAVSFAMPLVATGESGGGAAG